jgi:hypothetical protein
MGYCEDCIYYGESSNPQKYSGECQLELEPFSKECRKERIIDEGKE